MKILMLTTSFLSYERDPKGIFVYNFVNTLKTKLEVIVLCPNVGENSKEFKGIKIIRFNYFIKKFQTLADISIAEAVKTLSGLIQLPFFCISFLLNAIKQAKKSDLIHAQWIIPSGFIGVIIKKLYKKPLIATTRGSEILLANKNFIFRKILSYTIKNCDYVTSNNIEHIKIINKLGFTNTILIPNGLDYSLYKKKNKKIMRKKLNLGNKDKIILYVGFLIKRKRVDSLIKVFNELNNKYKDLKLIIIGDGPEEVKLREIVEKSKINEKVLFIGSLPPQEVPDYLNAADIFVLPSSYEGRPNALLEAMACELPVVTTNVGDVKEFIIDGQNGFIVDNEDIMFKRIEELLLNSKLRREFSKNGLKAVRKSNPSWEESTNQYIKLYNKLLLSHIS